MNVVLVYRGRYHVREAYDLETLASVLREQGHRVRLVYDPDTFGITDNVLQIPRLARRLSSVRRAVARVMAAQPEAVIFSVLPSTFGWSREVAAALKAATEAPLVFLGLHPSLAPQQVLADRHVDYVLAGEAENVAGPLLAAIAASGDVSQVGNLWRRRDGRPEFTYRAPLVDLDALPLPDKDLFAPFASQRYSYSAMVSRGCPLHCTFCEETCWKQLHGPRFFRRKRVETVLRELAAGKLKYRFREVIFKDSYLSGDKTWLRELLTRYRREIAVPFKCFCTVSGFDEETARWLKESGCYSIEFGLQTWNDRLRREILNRRETSQDALEAFACCDRVRLWYDVDHMFHLPTETREDHVLGAKRYQQLRRLGRIKVHYLMYLPTAKIVDHAIAAGDLPTDASQRLAEGLESDFFDQRWGRPEDQQTAAAFASLYKILPLLPRRLADWLVERNGLRLLRLIPSPLLALLQGINAVRCGDRRFLAYLNAYSAKVFHSLCEASPRRKRVEECC